LVCSGLVAVPGVVAQTPTGRADPRVGLRAGWTDAQSAASNLELVSHRDRPAHFANAANPGDFLMANSDLAFQGNLVLQGSFNGFQVWDITNASQPALRSSYVCPGGQGDLSVYRHLLFMSVEMPNGRVDCGQGSLQDSVNVDRFRGVRIFDISNIEKPRQVGFVQTCRGSHTHTLVTDARDSTHVYIYVSGAAPPRSKTEMAGCSGLAPAQDPNTSLFRIEVIRVPVAAPQNARIVNAPRLFADTAGNMAGLWPGGTHGAGTQTTALTDQCHDITVYSEMGVAAGACAGNGILIDVRDPANPRRIDEVMDPNFAYWHSATFSNDGSKIVFTDEWGGGVQARCRATDRPEWGANAIFTRGTGKMRLASYFKIPAAQTEQENCVAHNGSLIPVPGRDIMVQAWYQGGVSVFDFTDPDQPVEIAYFDRGPVGPQLVLGGHWSAYWYNGHIIASEIARGLDIFRLTPSEFLSKDEIEAARLVRVDHFNPQTQTKLVWPASFVVARAYLDGLVRSDALRKAWATPIYGELSAAEKASGAARRTALTALATRVDADAAGTKDAERVRALADAIRALANAR
jgi:hypothetical protein